MGGSGTDAKLASFTRLASRALRLVHPRLAALYLRFWHPANYAFCCLGVGVAVNWVAFTSIRLFVWEPAAFMAGVLAGGAHNYLFTVGAFRGFYGFGEEK